MDKTLNEMWKKRDKERESSFNNKIDDLSKRNINEKEEFSFQRELIEILSDVRYRIPDTITVHSSIDGTGLGFILGIMLSILSMAIYFLLTKR